MTLLSSIAETFSRPLQTVKPILEQASDGQLRTRSRHFHASVITDVTVEDSIKARFLFVAQLMMSCIAIPIIAIVGLIQLPFYDCTEEGSLLGPFSPLLLHLIIGIPVSLIGLFTPLSTAANAWKYLDETFF